MLYNFNKKLSYNDISICPAVISTIESRSECCPHLEDGFLPLFTAPMSTVVNEHNYDIFEKNGIHAILPRNIDASYRYRECIRNHKWAAFSLSEFERLFCDEKALFSNANVLIDIANGHIKKMYDLVKKSKDIHKGHLKVMIGNVANPETYRHVFECGADYVRISVGTGQGCITQSNTAIGYPIVSLIEEMCTVKKQIHSENTGIAWQDLPKIVADGGIRNYSDIIKALAVGADYVMIGSVFAKMWESAAPLVNVHAKWNTTSEIDEFWNNLDKVERREGKFWFKDKEITMYKLFYGMASKLGQKDLGLDAKTSEGIEKKVEVEYTIDSWVKNFKDYLRSAMSYCNARNLNEFKLAKVIPISQNTYLSINK